MTDAAPAPTYRTAPRATKGMPPGVPFIVGNEAAERFSFYGMKAILFVFMTQYLVTSTGDSTALTETEAREWVSWFNTAAYFFPLIGALVADVLWGKYRTILFISLFYCVGHGLLALMDLPDEALQATLEPQTFLMLGLLLIAVGAGGIKPCVSAHVGDQFGASNAHLLSKVFGWFYFSINVGSFASTLLTPWLLEHHGPGWAFGVPGVLMALATFTFWLGRNRFVHIPAGGRRFLTESLSGDGLRALGKLVPLYVFVAVFWSLYDQSASAWVGQAADLDRSFLGTEWLESQIQAINPLLILLMIPTFAYGIYPAVDRFWKLTPLRKIGIGFFLTAASFALTGVVEGWIGDARAEFDAEVLPVVEAGAVDWDATLAALYDEDRGGAARALERTLGVLAPVEGGDAPFDAAALNAQLADSELTEAQAGTLADAAFQAGAVLPADDGAPLRTPRPNIVWQLLAYVLLTAGEVMVSITCLEFSYTQAPPKMKSFVMALYFLSVSAGNAFTALVNRFTMDADGNSTLVGASYYWFFTNTMLVAAVIYVGFALWFQPRTYLQQESE